MTWPPWTTCNDLKSGKWLFFCCSWSCANWYLGFQNPFGNKWVSFISAVRCWTAHIVFASLPLVGNVDIKGSEVWGFLLLQKAFNSLKTFCLILWYLINRNGILVFPNLMVQGIINPIPSAFKVYKCTLAIKTFIQKKSSRHVLGNGIFIMDTGKKEECSFIGNCSSWALLWISCVLLVDFILKSLVWIWKV